MGLINPPLPTLGQSNASEDADVLNSLLVLRNLVNGELDAANLEDGAATEPKIADDAVTPRKVALGASGQDVTAAVVLSNGVVADLASGTHTPAVVGGVVLALASVDLEMGYISGGAGTAIGTVDLLWDLDGVDVAQERVELKANLATGGVAGVRLPVTVHRLFTGLSAALHTVKLQAVTTTLGGGKTISVGPRRLTLLPLG